MPAVAGHFQHVGTPRSWLVPEGRRASVFFLSPSKIIRSDAQPRIPSLAGGAGCLTQQEIDFRAFSGVRELGGHLMHWYQAPTWLQKNRPSCAAWKFLSKFDWILNLWSPKWTDEWICQFVFQKKTLESFDKWLAGLCTVMYDHCIRIHSAKVTIVGSSEVCAVRCGSRISVIPLDGNRQGKALNVTPGGESNKKNSQRLRMILLGGGVAKLHTLDWLAFIGNDPTPHPRLKGFATTPRTTATTVGDIRPFHCQLRILKTWLWGGRLPVVRNFLKKEMLKSI